MERVFEEREMTERYNFSKMLLHYFTPCAPSKSHVSGLSATELYRLYLVHNPHSKLTSAIVNSILLMGGYVRSETGKELELFAEVDEEAFLAAPHEIQVVILKHMVGPMEIKYRQFLLGIKVKQVGPDGKLQLIDNPVNSVSVFLARWTINQHDRYHYYMKPQHRSTCTEVFNFYRVICATYQMPIVSRKVFVKTLDQLGNKIVAGAVHGKAGYKYFKNVYIPQSTDDIKLSLDINAVAIFNGHSHWTKDNELVENYTEALLYTLRESNLRRMNIYEQPRREAAPEEDINAKSHYRRTAEVLQTPVSIKEATPEERRTLEELLGQSSETEDQTSEIEDSEVERTSMVVEPESSADESSLERTDAGIDIASSDDDVDVHPSAITSGELDPGTDADGHEDDGDAGDPDPVIHESITSDIRARSSNRRIVRNSAAKRILSEFDPDSGSDGAEESSFGGEFVESVDAGFEEIAEAMKIPYQLTPKGQFTVDVFADWLKKMGINVPDAKAYYKHVMPLVMG